MGVRIHEVLADTQFTTDDIPDGELVSGVVVLIHTVSSGDGQEGLTIANSEGMGAFTQTGIVAEAWRLVNSGDDE